MTTEGRRRTERWPFVWAALCMVLLVAIASLSIALSAALSSNKVASCVNHALGQRAATTVSDADAHVLFAQAVLGLFLTPKATQAQRAHEAEVFKAQVETYVRTLVANQQFRASHPLGRC
jgi:hypothetical protein